MSRRIRCTYMCPLQPDLHKNVNLHKASAFQKELKERKIK